MLFSRIKDRYHKATMFQIFTIPCTKFTILFVVILNLFFAHNVAATPADKLANKYEEIEDELLENNYDIPVYLESSDIENTMRGDVYGILYYPFKTVRHALTSLKNWCEIMPQHLNIKACTYQHRNKQCSLSFYSGRKFYQKADNVYRLNYNFKVSKPAPEYFRVSLQAKQGPVDTSDYNILVEATPLSDSSTFIHFSYEYKYGFWTSMGMSTYLATLGSDKVGFTIENTDENDKPVYIKGVRGIVERNAIRYYLAIQSYLDTQTLPAEKQFLKRISHWFDLTEQYHQQLYEMDKKDYIKYKKLERQDQLQLQKVISKSNNINSSEVNCN